MSSIIAIDDLTYAWPEAVQPTLRDLAWQVPAGAFALLIGRSGAGKSTLLRALNGLVPHFSGGTFGGQVVVNGIDTRDVAPRDVARHVGFVSQDPEAQLLTSRVVDDIALGMEHHGVAPSLMRKRVEEMLDLVGIAHLRDRDPHTLSGGEQQRVAIAAALALHPPILVLDEPTSQLDPWGAEEVIAALQRMNDDLGLTIVMSEHRLERVLSHADTVRLLDNDGLPTDGTPAEIAHVVAPIALPPVAQLARHLGAPRIPLTVKEARGSQVFVDVRQRLAGICPPAASVPVGGDVMMRLDGVGIDLGKTRILANASFSLHQGEIVAVMGRNGSGKTTLMRSIMGFVPVAHGHISFAGSEPRIGYVPQRSGVLFFCETLGDELRYTAKRRGVAIDVEARLAEMQLDWAINRHPSTLSVGERQRAAIAVVLAGDPTMLLLDEPTRGMDPWHKRLLMECLQRLRGRGLAILMATHDIEMTAEYAQRVMLLGDGGIVCDAAPASVLTDSLTWSTQINKVMGGQWLTVGQVLRAIEAE